MAETLTTRYKIIKNDDNEFVDIDEINAGWDKVDNGFVPAAKLRSTVTQSIPTASTTTMTFNQTVFDSFAARAEGAMADLSNESIIVRIPGLYLVTAQLVFVVNVTGYRGISIKRNATILKRNTTDGNTQTGIDTAMQVSDIYAMSAADVITATAIQASGGNLNLDPTINGLQDACSLSAVWLGALTEV